VKVKGCFGLEQQIWLGVVEVTCVKVPPMEVQWLLNALNLVQPVGLQLRQTLFPVLGAMEGLTAWEAPVEILPERVTAWEAPVEILAAWEAPFEGETLAARDLETLAAFEGDTLAARDLEMLLEIEMDTLDFADLELVTLALRDLELLLVREMDTLDFADLELVTLDLGE